MKKSNKQMAKTNDKKHLCRKKHGFLWSFQKNTVTLQRFLS